MGNFNKEKKQHKADVSEAEKYILEQGEVFKAIVATEAGCIWLWDLMAECGIMQNAHTNNALETAFRCGKQSIGQKVFNQLEEADPSFWVRLREVHKNGGRS